MSAESALSTPPGPGNAYLPKTAFVFAGGGSFGCIQVGMLRALVAHGVTADMVVGSSVGAMNAAYYAGTPTAEGVEKLAAIWRSLRRQDVFPITLRTLIGFIRRRDFLVAADGVRRLIDTQCPIATWRRRKSHCTWSLPIFSLARPLSCRKGPSHRQASRRRRFPPPLRRYSSTTFISLTARSRATRRLGSPYRAARAA